MAWGYQEWRLQAFCGATPASGWAATRVEARCPVAAEADAAWWRMSLRVLEQLARQHAPLEHWLRRARGSQGTGLCGPLHAGWLALQAAMGCPSYPTQLSLQGAGRADTGPNSAGASHPRDVALHVACPYPPFVRHALLLIRVWLGWSHAAWQQGRLELRREQLQQWYAEFDRLATLLPAPPLMVMHHRLWQRGVTWEWLGEDRTRVGEGVRQRVVSGAALDMTLDEPDAWHVPIYTVTGSVGKTTTARLLWQLLQHSGQTLALAASDGAWIGRHRVIEGDCIGGVTARALLQSPMVQAAVFEQGRGGIIRQGVPYSRSDVAVLLNVQPVHLGQAGIATLHQMADIKAVGLNPARVWVLNLDDEQCRRLAERHPADVTVWFSVSASSESLQTLSRAACAALGVEREAGGEPQAINVWQAGRMTERWPLEGVAPYHGLLGDKTLEELLAAVAAAYFGPLEVSKSAWPERLRALQLDADNHVFRTSVHRQGGALFVLDKAGEPASLRLLQESVESLAQREGCNHRIAVFCRGAAYAPEYHRETVASLYGFMDEFVCFDRPDTYTSRAALPIYAPGSIPRLLCDELTKLNDQYGLSKVVVVVDDWAQAESYLRRRLAAASGKTLVLINQPGTGAAVLNQQIHGFATGGLNVSIART